MFFVNSTRKLARAEGGVAHPPSLRLLFTSTVTSVSSQEPQLQHFDLTRRLDIFALQLLTSAMRVPLLACGLLASLVSVASATALTYKVGPNEKACFYAAVDNKGAKVAFYFAVSLCASRPFLCFRRGIRIDDCHCTVVANRYKPAALSM